jgi:hypothetical protein
MTAPRTSRPALPATVSRRTVLGAAAASSASALLVACGGGGDDPAPTTPPTGGGTATTSSYTDGVISGFGSVIVGGVRFDDSAASITTEDGTAVAASAMKLGMTIEIEGGRIDNAAASPWRWASV